MVGAYCFGRHKEVYKGEYILNIILDSVLSIIMVNCMNCFAALDLLCVFMPNNLFESHELH